MIVVSDTSAITALLTINSADLLKDLFGFVIVPQTVQRELLCSHPQTPDWIRIQSVRDAEAVGLLLEKSIHRGEAEAIQLAKELKADRLLIDDLAGRRVAAAEGLSIIGLLGVVILAKANGHINSARELLNRLTQESNVYWSKEIVEEALKRVGE